MEAQQTPGRRLVVTERDKLWNTQSVQRSREEKLFYKPWRGRRT